MAIALIVAGAATALPAEAQSSLPVYSSDFGGPNSAAPSGAARDTYIDMGVPRLQTVHRRLLEVRRLLHTHAIPPHQHPHSHGICVTPTVGDGDGDGGDGGTDGGDGGNDGGPPAGTPSATPGPGEMGHSPDASSFTGPENGGDGAGGGGSR